MKTIKVKELEVPIEVIAEVEYEKEYNLEISYT